MKHFPIYTDISNRKIWIIGGGQIATRRVTTLLSFCSNITIIAPILSNELHHYVLQGKITWIDASLTLDNAPTVNSISSLFLCPTADFSHRKPFSSLLKEESPYIILALTNDRSINHAIAEIAKNTSILVNVCDCQEECDFYFPAIIETKQLTASITANGTNHKLVRKVAAQIRELLHRIESS